MLASEDARGKIQVEGGCWRWVGRDFVFFGLRPVDLLYAAVVGPVGKGITLEGCDRNGWCVNPTHWRRLKETKATCRHGHVLIHGKCRICKTLAQARWRAKLKAKMRT